MNFMCTMGIWEDKARNYSKGTGPPAQAGLLRFLCLQPGQEAAVAERAFWPRRPCS